MKTLQVLAVSALMAAAAYGIPVATNYGKVSNTGTSAAGCIGTAGQGTNSTLTAGCALVPNGTISDPNFDPLYKLVSAPAGSSYQTVALSSLTGGLTANTTSRWISPNNAGTADPAGAYTYTQTFSLASVNASQHLTGRWSSDNSATLSLNGVQFSSRVGNASNVWTPFTIGSGFQVGLNTLAFVVTNTASTVGDTPSGLRVEFGTVHLPEAYETTTFSVVLGGLLLWGLKRRKAGAGA